MLSTGACSLLPADKVIKNYRVRKTGFTPLYFTG